MKMDEYSRSKWARDEGNIPDSNTGVHPSYPHPWVPAPTLRRVGLHALTRISPPQSTEICADGLGFAGDARRNVGEIERKSTRRSGLCTRHVKGMMEKGDFECAGGMEEPEGPAPRGQIFWAAKRPRAKRDIAPPPGYPPK
ncbi:hypothetical protein B0H13DRAFT_2277942 [Mycena leptocephala]|nr:hypothetical protein B0H13DRAFT_2277942 [Mycena leptocephala]